MATNAPFAVGILGLGQIAHGYDEPGGPAISTHIKACQANPQLRIAWISDVDNAKAKEVRRKWNLTADVVNCEDTPNRPVDVVCIASPDETHPQWIRRFLGTPPKIIFCEKPLSESAARSRELISIVQAAQSILVVNFIRRWIPSITPWLRAAAVGDFGAPKQAKLTYCRGLYHSACHGLDLIGAALGSDVDTISKSGDPIFDFSQDDPTLSALVQVRSNGVVVPLSVIGVDSRLGYVFDLEIVFSTSCIRVWNNDGIRVRISDQDGNEISEFHDKPARHMEYVWENLVGVLSENAAPMFDVSDILSGAKLVDAVASAQK